MKIAALLDVFRSARKEESFRSPFRTQPGPFGDSRASSAHGGPRGEAGGAPVLLSPLVAAAAGSASAAQVEAVAEGLRFRSPPPGCHGGRCCALSVLPALWALLSNLRANTKVGRRSGAAAVGGCTEMLPSSRSEAARRNSSSSRDDAALRGGRVWGPERVVFQFWLHFATFESLVFRNIVVGLTSVAAITKVRGSSQSSSRNRCWLQMHHTELL